MLYSYCIRKILYNKNSLNIKPVTVNGIKLIPSVDQYTRKIFNKNNIENNLKNQQNLFNNKNKIKNKFEIFKINQNSIIMSRCLNSSLLGLVAISATGSGGGGVGVVDSSANGSTITNSTNSINKILVKTTAPAATRNIHSNMPNQDNTKRLEQASIIIKNSDIVCFDVDSTVIIEEGIDELAKFCGKGSEVALLTQSAMGGSMTFQDALRIRLDIIRPTQKQIREFLKLHPSTLSPGIKEFIHSLRRNGTTVYLISGGFDCLIEPVANELGIPLSNVFANKLMFYFDGEYAGFDTNQPTSRSGGKGEAISIIKKSINSDASITMIGDGATDLEACPPANYFIGYGGNVIRNEVQQRSEYYITDFNQIKL